MRIRVATTDDAEALVATAEDGRITGMAHTLPQHFVTDDPFVELAALVVDETAVKSL